jgi:hypothetical protein
MAIGLVFDQQFIRTKVLQVLNGLQIGKDYTRADVETYWSALLDRCFGISGTKYNTWQRMAEIVI